MRSANKRCFSVTCFSLSNANSIVNPFLCVNSARRSSRRRELTDERSASSSRYARPNRTKEEMLLSLVPPLTEKSLSQVRSSQRMEDDNDDDDDEDDDDDDDDDDDENEDENDENDNNNNNNNNSVDSQSNDQT
jgi:hypothetical protein